MSDILAYLVRHKAGTDAIRQFMKGESTALIGEIPSLRLLEAQTFAGEDWRGEEGRVARPG